MKRLGRNHSTAPQRQPTTDELYGPQANVISLAKWRETKELMGNGRGQAIPDQAS